MIRELRPEILDSLSPDHPDAQGSRRDLRLINRIMGNHRWFEQTLPALLRQGERVLEVGSGTGELGHRLASAGAMVDGLDLCPAPRDWPPDRAWHKVDAKAFAGFSSYRVVIGNLIFHQFSDSELGDLGVKLRESARLVVACEPARSRRSQFLLRVFAPLFRANPVTRHDAQVSVAAGFLPGELPRALGLTDGSWRYSCRRSALGALRMVALRHP
jgi:hypothetical protein